MTLVLQHRSYLEKTALPIGGLAALARMLIPRASSAKRTLFSGVRKLAPSSLANRFLPYASKAEKMLGNTATRYLSPSAAAQTKKLIARVPHSAVRGATSGTVIGGLLGGGIGAAFSEEGERTKGFFKGLGSGAVLGGLSGGTSGAVEGLAKNLRTQALQRSATANNMAYPALRRKITGTGVIKSLGNLHNPADPLAQTAARHKIIGGTAALAAPLFADSYVYNKADKLMHGEDRPAPPPPPQNPPLAPNAPMIYSQPQYYKSSSDKTRLKPIDFTKMPRYHR